MDHEEQSTQPGELGRPQPTPPIEGAVQRVRPRRGSHRAQRVTLGVGLLALVVTAGLTVSRGRTEPAPTATPVPSAPASKSGPPPAASSPTVTRPPGTLFGVSLPRGQAASQALALDRLRQQFGRLPVARVFAPGLPSATWADDPVLAALGSGSAVVYSFRGDPTAAAAGQYDDRVTALLASRPPGVTVWMAFYHEPEDQVASGTFTAEQFRAATAHLAPVIRGGGGISTTILQEYTLQTASGRDWHEFYSPAIDVLGWDAYNIEAKHGTPTYKTAQEFVGPVLVVAKETGKPFAWAEFGSPCIRTDPDCSQRAEWVRNVGQAFRDSGARFATYWNRETMDGQIDYTLRDAPSIAAYRRLVSG